MVELGEGGGCSVRREDKEEYKSNLGPVHVSLILGAVKSCGNTFVNSWSSLLTCLQGHAALERDDEVMLLFLD